MELIIAYMSMTIGLAIIVVVLLAVVWMQSRSLKYNRERVRYYQDETHKARERLAETKVKISIAMDELAKANKFRATMLQSHPIPFIKATRESEAKDS